MNSSVAPVPRPDPEMASSNLQNQILHQNFEILDLTEKLSLTNAHLVPKQKQLIAKLEDEVQYWKRQAEEATARCEKQQKDFNLMREGMEDAIDKGVREEIERVRARKEAYDVLNSKYMVMSEISGKRVEQAEAENNRLNAECERLIEGLEKSEAKCARLIELANRSHIRENELVATIRAKNNLLQDQAGRFERIRQALPVPTEAPPAYRQDEADETEENGANGENGEQAADPHHSPTSERVSSGRHAAEPCHCCGASFENPEGSQSVIIHYHSDVHYYGRVQYDSAVHYHSHVHYYMDR